MTTGSEQQARTYFGWQHEKVNFVFGMTAQRAAMTAGAVLSAIWPLASGRMSSAFILWPVAILLAAMAFIRIGGRTSDEWVLAFVSHHFNAFRDQNRFLSAAFAPDAVKDKTAPKPMDLPGILAPIKILEGPGPHGGNIAIAYHRLTRSYTAVARVRYSGISLVDSTRREQRVAGWGGLLAGLCTEGNPIVRVQTLQRIVPESGAALRRWHADHVAEAAPEAAVVVTSGLLATATLSTSQREAYLAFTMDERKASAAIKGAGGGTAAAAEIFTRHLRAMSASIAGADLQIESWLTARDLGEVIRSAFDPHSGRHLAERRANASVPGADGLPAGVDPAVSGPAAAESQPHAYLHDGAQSVTYWVHDWPRSQVYATVLAPLLGEGSHRRSFSMHIEPLGPRTASRQVMGERTKRSVAIGMRNKSKQIVPEHEKQALARADAQDAELAAGHGLVRFTGYVTVTVTDPAELEDACAALEADAAASRVEVRRMWFAHDQGFVMGALPLGMGLPRKRF